MQSRKKYERNCFIGGLEGNNSDFMLSIYEIWNARATMVILLVIVDKNEKKIVGQLRPIFVSIFCSFMKVGNVVVVDINRI